MKKLLALALLFVPCTLFGADVLTELKLDEAEVRQVFTSFVEHGSVYLPGWTEQAHAVPPARRAATVKALGQVARGIFASAAFKASYREYWMASRPTPPKPLRKPEAIIKEQTAELDANWKTSEEQLKRLPKEQQKELRDALAKMIREQKKLQSDKKLVAQIEQGRFESEKAEYERALAEAPPEDPKVALRTALQKLLELTEGIDFQAELVQAGERMRFAKDEYEAKPPEWKMGFRAGKEATETARAEAQKWLAELAGPVKKP